MMAQWEQRFESGREQMKIQQASRVPAVPGRRALERYVAGESAINAACGTAVEAQHKGANTNDTAVQIH